MSISSFWVCSPSSEKNSHGGNPCPCPSYANEKQFGVRANRSYLHLSWSLRRPVFLILLVADPDGLRTIINQRFPEPGVLQSLFGRNAILRVIDENPPQ